MKNARHDHSIHAAIGQVKSDEPTIELKSYSSAGKDMARVVIDVTHSSKSRGNAALILASIGRKLQGRFEAVRESFVTVSSGAFTDRITGVVGKVREIVAVDENALKGFRAISSNMFMDDEKDMWALKRTVAGDILIKTSSEDDLSLLNLLEATASAGHRSSHEYGQLQAMCSAIASQVQGGSYVSYVDLNNQVVMGFVVATTDEDEALVLQQGAKEAEVIKTDAVVDVHNQEGFPEPALNTEEVVDQEVALSSGRVDINYMIDYYKRIYNSDPKFFLEFAKRIKQHSFC